MKISDIAKGKRGKAGWEAPRTCNGRVEMILEP